MDGIEVARDGDSWRVFDDVMQDSVGVPDRWTDDDVREVAEQWRRRAAWYDAVLAARHPAP